MDVVAIAAMTPDRVIATESGVPWDYPEDERQYKERVRDDPVVLGRRTYQSMYPDLPGRRQIVLSRSDHTADLSTAVYVTDPDEALSEARRSDAETLYVIGGGQIYALFLDDYDRMTISVVEDEVDDDAAGVVRFPEWDRSAWEKARTDDSYSGFRIDFWERSTAE